MNNSVQQYNKHYSKNILNDHFSLNCCSVVLLNRNRTGSGCVCLRVRACWDTLVQYFSTELKPSAF